ncbi:MAG: peptidase M60 [Roseibacillus sp.]|nr:peptidase M60 [Roseibacillus sp.]
MSLTFPIASLCLGSAILSSMLSLEAHAGEAELKEDFAFFQDPTCVALKTEVGESDLTRFKTTLLRDVARQLLEGSYDTRHRAASYQAYPSPSALQRMIKLGDGFSRYENITGIYLEAGRHVVLVGDTGGRKISLLIPEWMRKPPPGIEPSKDPAGWGLKRQEIGIRPGLNTIEVKKSGLVYLNYYDQKPEQAPRILVHFLTGKVNGYFDSSQHDNEDWNKLLDNAVAPILDARGKHIQVAYPVEWFNIHTRGKGAELMRNYDTMLLHHYTILGLVKYDKIPPNRILARVNYNYYMFRDRDGVAYFGNKGTMRMVADPDVVTKGDPCWGFCHEAGHVLQLRPQITWGGMTEVSCNIFSMYTRGKMGNPSRLASQDNYTKARKSIIQSEPKISYLQDPDVFNRLVPFWQLHLFFTKHGHPDFYADVMEEMRNQPDAGRGNDSIRNQFQFVRICCDVGKVDLTEFFEHWGFFRTGEIKVKDYRNYHFVVTPEMVDETRSYIARKNYKKPAEDLTRLRD